MKKMIDKENNTYTVIFTIIMVIVVGSVLAGLSTELAPYVTKNVEIEKMQNILFAMNISDPEDMDAFVPKEQVDTIFKQYVGPNQYIIKGSDFIKTEETFTIDVRKEAGRSRKNPEYLRNLPVFVGVNQGEVFYILPVEGKGLWGDIWGYISLNEDFTRIKGAFFDHQTETAGLGANIKEAFFRDDFKGESIVDDQGNFKGVTVAKGNSDPLNERKDDNKVDALAGATITGNGVSTMIKKGIGLYLPYLELIKNEIGDRSNQQSL